MQYVINESEASSLKDFIEYYFIESIRNDKEVDSLLYIYNIMSVYERIGGLKQFSDYEPNNK